MTTPLRITIVGAGNVGTALAQAWLAAGHHVAFATRGEPDPRVAALVEAHGATASIRPAAGAAHDADVVLAAVPAVALVDAVAAAAPGPGTLVLDATNPVGPGFTHALPQGSNADRLASAHPALKVAKVFNTVGANVMRQPRFANGTAVMPYATDHADVRPVVERLIAAVGFESLDAGGLARARLLEHQALLWISLSVGGGLGREFAFGLLRR